ncbi:lipoate--protein ligase family protein [bacterium]|nr:lipoate--protein ligase family protein [bacterium]
MSPEFGRPWRFLDSGPGGAAFNMALDEAILRAVSAGESPPVLRVYRWSGPAVSLGYAQRAGRELDLAACAAAGVSVVRRLTGGRAVWHDDELTYSFAGPSGTERLGGSISESWWLIAQAIAGSLEGLGARTDLAATGWPRKAASHPGSANPCFSSATRHEIAFQGRKLVGSAQRRVEGAFLQQGSLLLTNCQGRFLDFLPAWVDEDSRARMRQALEQGVTGLDRAAGRYVCYEEAAAAFHLGFAQSFGTALEPDTPSDFEMSLARHLARSRYSDPDWPNRERKNQ